LGASRAKGVSDAEKKCKNGGKNRGKKKKKYGKKMIERESRGGESNARLPVLTARALRKGLRKKRKTEVLEGSAYDLYQGKVLLEGQGNEPKKEKGSEEEWLEYKHSIL